MTPDRIKKLAQAEKDGRLVVLPTGPKMLECCPMRHDNGNCIPAGGFCMPDTEICKALHAAYENGVFDAKASWSAQPNDPLTLEELREMDGEPVWIMEVTTGISYWAIVMDVQDCGICFCKKTDPYDYGSFGLYGKTWLAYRRRPKEGTV